MGDYWSCLTVWTTKWTPKLFHLGKFPAFWKLLLSPLLTVVSLSTAISLFDLIRISTGWYHISKIPSLNCENKTVRIALPGSWEFTGTHQNLTLIWLTIPPYDVASLIHSPCLCQTHHALPFSNPGVAIYLCIFGALIQFVLERQKFIEFLKTTKFQTKYSQTVEMDLDSHPEPQTVPSTRAQSQSHCFQKASHAEDSTLSRAHSREPSLTSEHLLLSSAPLMPDYSLWSIRAQTELPSLRFNSNVYSKQALP